MGMTAPLPMIRWAQTGEYDAFWEIIIYPDASWEVVGGTYVSRRNRGTLSDELQAQVRASLPATAPHPAIEPPQTFRHQLHVSGHTWVWASSESPPDELKPLLALLNPLYAGSEKSR